MGRVSVEDQHQFILHHRVMQQEVDVEVAVRMIQETKATVSGLSSCSFDQGFHSPSNQRGIIRSVGDGDSTEKGRLSKKRSRATTGSRFYWGRCQHAAVESAIHALEVHGLDRCPDWNCWLLSGYVLSHCSSKFANLVIYSTTNSEI